MILSWLSKPSLRLQDYRNNTDETSLTLPWLLPNSLKKALAPRPFWLTCFDRCRWCWDWFVFIQVLAQRPVSYRAITCRFLSIGVNKGKPWSDAVPSCPVTVFPPKCSIFGKSAAVAVNRRWCKVLKSDLVLDVNASNILQRIRGFRGHLQGSCWNAWSTFLFGFSDFHQLGFLDPKWEARNLEGPAGLMHFKAAQGSRLKQQKANEPSTPRQR